MTAVALLRAADSPSDLLETTTGPDWRPVTTNGPADPATVAALCELGLIALRVGDGFYRLTDLGRRVLVAADNEAYWAGRSAS